MIQVKTYGVDKVTIGEMLPTRAEARAVNHKHYFTSKPCKHGHIEPRYTKTASCVECQRIASKERAARTYIPSPKLKLTPEQKAEKRKAYYRKNADKINKRQREYQAKEKEKIKERKAIYYQENKTKILEGNKAYRKENFLKITKTEREYYRKNREKILERKRLYYLKNREEILRKKREKK
jgi:hypothetical protein